MDTSLPPSCVANENVSSKLLGDPDKPIYHDRKHGWRTTFGPSRDLCRCDMAPGMCHRRGCAFLYQAQSERQTSRGRLVDNSSAGIVLICEEISLSILIVYCV